MKRATIRLRDSEAKLVKRLARKWRVPERDVLELAVWAYVRPLVAELEAPHELPNFNKAHELKAELARGKR